MDLDRALDAVTRRRGEGYEDFVARAGTDPLGRTIKILDLRDNAARTSGEGQQKYRRALEQLGG